MAMIPEAFVSRLSDLVFNLVTDEVGMLLGVPGEIQKLKTTLGDISEVLADAEKKRMMGDDEINNWLVDLKDVMYDADDILDEFTIVAAAEESSRVQIGRSAASSSSSKPPVCFRFSDLFPNLLSCFRNPVFTHEIGKRIRSLNDKLDEISARKSNLELLKLSPRPEDYTRASGSGSGSRISKRTSSVLEPDIVGDKINAETRVVVEWLTSEDDSENKLLVYGMVGMGGIGKTTLAKKIYNDPRIISSFSTTNRMWACVSQEFGEDKLLKDIIKSAGGIYGSADGRTLLEPILESSLRGKKFLLVLDDVWDPKVWGDLLRRPLMSGDFGSRILVTTRHEEVANQMKAVRVLPVGLLDLEVEDFRDMAAGKMGGMAMGGRRTLQ